MATALPEAFFILAEARLRQHAALAHRWTQRHDRTKRTLEIPAEDRTGFGILVDCEIYGLYVYCDGWHGAPFEVGGPTKTPEAAAENCLGFVRTLLSEDSTLEVHYAAGKPHRWVLSYATDSGTEREETGLFFYNYFGRRSVRTLQNRRLPARYTQSAV